MDQETGENVKSERQVHMHWQCSSREDDVKVGLPLTNTGGVQRRTSMSAVLALKQRGHPQEKVFEVARRSGLNCLRGMDNELTTGRIEDQSRPAAQPLTPYAPAPMARENAVLRMKPRAKMRTSPKGESRWAESTHWASSTRSTLS